MKTRALVAAGSNLMFFSPTSTEVDFHARLIHFAMFPQGKLFLSHSDSLFSILDGFTWYDDTLLNLEKSKNYTKNYINFLYVYPE